MTLGQRTMTAKKLQNKQNAKISKASPIRIQYYPKERNKSKNKIMKAHFQSTAKPLGSLPKWGKKLSEPCNCIVQIKLAEHKPDSFHDMISISTLTETNLGIDTIRNNTILCFQFHVITAAELCKSPEHCSIRLNGELMNDTQIVWMKQEDTTGG